MKTVQLAIRNSEYARSLRDSLLGDGTHRVYLVDEPDLRIDGIVVIDGNTLDKSLFLGGQPERFVVVTGKGTDSLSRLWNAGIRHVVFEGDAPGTAHLAVIAAEMRLPNSGPKATSLSGASGEKHHARHGPTLPVFDPTPRCGRCSYTSMHKYSFRGF